jgi:polysaccharide export outer membrane protein
MDCQILVATFPRSAFVKDNWRGGSFMMRTLVPLCFFAVSCATVQSVFPEPSHRTFSHNGEYIVGPGDTLMVAPSDTRETPTQVVVSPSGNVQLPLIGDVETTGQTLPQLSQKISQKYSQYYKKTDFFVNIQELRSYKTFVIGEVRNSGEYSHQSKTTVLGALAKAGGRTDFATGKITLIRRKNSGTSHYEFSFDALLVKESQAEPIYVERDDIIVVH